MPLKVYIHFGPPKTGTSAIQKWLIENQSSLKAEGIYYPSHNIDVNGVSSGNLTSLFDLDKDGQLSFSNKKAKELVKVADNLGAKKLLLSSEFFLRHLGAILEYFPDAIVVGYVRCPLEVIESSYNQGVKRSKQTLVFNPPKVAHTPFLDMIAQSLSSNSRLNYILRPYEPSLFQGGNLIIDFLSVFSLQHLVRGEDSQIVNSSYSFEALEAKRWFNQFDVPELDSLLDKFFQAYPGKINRFSLIKPDEYQRLANAFHSKAKEFCRKFNVINAEQLLSVLENRQQKPYFSQKLDDKSFEAVIIALVSQSPEIIPSLRMCLSIEKNSLINNPDWLDIIAKRVPAKGVLESVLNIKNSVRSRVRQFGKRLNK